MFYITIYSDNYLFYVFQFHNFFLGSMTMNILIADFIRFLLVFRPRNVALFEMNHKKDFCIFAGKGTNFELSRKMGAGAYILNRSAMVYSIGGSRG